MICWSGSDVARISLFAYVMAFICGFGCGSDWQKKKKKSSVLAPTPEPIPEEKK